MIAAEIVRFPYMSLFLIYFVLFFGAFFTKRSEWMLLYAGVCLCPYLATSAVFATQLGVQARLQSCWI